MTNVFRLAIYLFLLAVNEASAQSGSCPLLGPNQVVNGNFEGGYYGFLSDYGRGVNNATQDGCATQGWILISQVNPHVSPGCQIFPATWSAQYGGANVPTSADPNHPSNTWVITTAICSNADLLPDHTTGYGYFLTADPDTINNRAFWKKNIEVCPNTPYEFSVWVHNISGIPAPLYHLEIDGQSINQPTSFPDHAWVKSSATWFSGSVSGPVKLALVNDQPGCIENDVAFDDIFFGICGGVLPTADTIQRFCLNEPPPYLVLSGEVIGISDAAFQWQKYQSTSMTWADLPGETGDSLVFTNPDIADAGHYRLLAAQDGNITSPHCRVNSTVFRIEALPFYTVEETKSTCTGDVYLGYQTTGMFVDTLQSRFGCDSVRTLHLTVHPVFNMSLAATICEGENYGGHVLPGVYTDSLSSTSGCDSVRTVQLTVYPSYHEEAYVLLCPGENVVFNGENISNEGIYTSVLSTVEGCDSTMVLDVEVVRETFLGNDTLICIATHYTLLSPSPDTRWFDGTIGQTKTVQASGMYWASVSDNNGCVVADTVDVQFSTRTFVPNIFSPNDDGVNDLFMPQFSNPFFQSYLLQVYDRWGNQVFETESLEHAWDGRINGRFCEPGVYVYALRFVMDGCGETVLTGDVSLLR